MEQVGDSVAVIAGVTCMVGLSLAEALKKPSAPGSPWKVYGLARQPLPTWFPSGLIDEFISYDALDLNDTIERLSPVASEVTHLFWLGVQRRESEEMNISVNSTMLINVLTVLKSSIPSRLKHITLQTGTKHYMGPIYDPKFANQLLHQEPPFCEDLPRLPYPNFYYALEDILASHLPSITTYSVHRSSIIIGASSRSIHNSLLTFSVYATICRGLPFKFPGSQYTWNHFCDMTDASVLAEQHIWAAVVSDKAKNQAFNCTNGDIFTWKGLWKELSEIFDLDFVAFDKNEKFDFYETMKDKGEVWEEIVAKHGLFKTKFEDIMCFGALKTVLNFRFQHVCSMNKSREFGFMGFANTFKSIRMWVEKLRDMKIIP